MKHQPLGFADTRQTAEFFGLPKREVTELAQAGVWPSWIIAGRRVFDLDQIVKKLARQPAGHPEVPQCREAQA